MRPVVTETVDGVVSRGVYSGQVRDTVTIDNETILAGDIDAQQGEAPEDVQVDPTDVLSMAKAIQAGVPILAVAEAHEALQLTTHTWTPGIACPMRSINRKVHAMTSIYNLAHPDNTIEVPVGLGEVNWLARCETHHADLYSKAFGPAWKARNRPWTFCAACAAVYDTRHGGTVVAKGKRARSTVAVVKPEPKAPKQKAAKAPTSEKAPQAAQEHAHLPPADDDDAELATWNTWSQRIASEAPKGSTVDWLGPYYYAVTLADKRQIEFRVHKDVATFKYHEADGTDHYAENLKAMLAIVS